MPRIVLSASRRTDVPAFYMPWFMESIEKGHFDVVNPYNNRAFRVPAGPERIHSIVFWSKNFGPFNRGGYGRRLRDMGYGLFFNFTINSVQALLEPYVPPLTERLDQLDELSKSFGPDCINWRFDPICFFKSAAGKLVDNLDQFPDIASRASHAGITACISSVVDHYRKVLRRIQHHGGLTLIDPPLDHKRITIRRLADHLAALNLELHLCCEKELLDALPPGAPVRASACIPGHRLAALYGPDISTARDSGQRRKAGCMCTVSRDIGSYGLHPCRHNCLFCYANPAFDQCTEHGMSGDKNLV